MPKKREAWIFYSSESEPELPVVYEQGIQYLHESDVETHVIDVHKHPELAEKHKIMATPTIVIKKGKETEKIVGVVDGLRKLMAADLGGKSILHMFGFKQGREMAGRIEMPREKKELEGKLTALLSSKGISGLKLKEFDIKINHAKISLNSDLAKEHEKSKTPVCFEIAALLGGIFTEIFHVGTFFEEKKCMAQGNECCEFETSRENKNAEAELGNALDKIK